MSETAKKAEDRFYYEATGGSQGGDVYMVYDRTRPALRFTNAVPEFIDIAECVEEKSADMICRALNREASEDETPRPTP